MALFPLKPTQQEVGPKLREVVGELQRQKIAVVAGTTADTDIAVDIHPLDTVITAVNLVDADDLLDELVIVSRKASSTITISGDPVADETVTVAGIAYTWKAAANVTHTRHVAISTGDNTAMATALAAAINDYEESGAVTQTVTASSAAGVVTVTALADGTGGNSITLAEASTNVVVGNATLENGVDAGAIQFDTTDTSTDQILVVWYDKDPAI